MSEGRLREEVTKIGTIYLDDQTKKLVYVFNDPQSFTKVLKTIDMDTESLELLDKFVTDDSKLKSYLARLEWSELAQSVVTLPFDKALLIKMATINLRLLAYKENYAGLQEIKELLKEIQAAKQQKIFHGENSNRWNGVLQSVLLGFARNLSRGLLDRLSTPLKEYIESIDSGQPDKEIKADLSFLVELTARNDGMIWVNQNGVDLWKVIEKVVENKSDGELLELGCWIHRHSILAGIGLHPEMISKASSLEPCYLASENVALLGILLPQREYADLQTLPLRLTSRILSFLSPLQPHELLKSLRVFRIHIQSSLLMKNTPVLLSTLELNVGKLAMRTLKTLKLSILTPDVLTTSKALDKKTDQDKIGALIETLNILTMLSIDNSIIDVYLAPPTPLTPLSTDLLALANYFLTTANHISQSSPSLQITLLSLLTNLMKLKSYSFNKADKILVLAFLLKSYDSSSNPALKVDLMHILRELAQIKEVNRLLHEHEVLVELNIRSEVSEIEEIVKQEIDQRAVVSEEEYEIPEVSNESPLNYWGRYFVKYNNNRVVSPPPKMNADIINKGSIEMRDQRENKVEQDTSNTVTKLSKAQELMNMINSLQAKNPSESYIRLKQLAEDVTQEASLQKELNKRALFEEEPRSNFKTRAEAPSPDQSKRTITDSMIGNRLRNHEDFHVPTEQTQINELMTYGRQATEASKTSDNNYLNNRDPSPSQERTDAALYKKIALLEQQLAESLKMVSNSTKQEAVVF